MNDAGADEPCFAVLGDGAAIDDDQMYQLYAYPDVTGWIVRGNAIASLDGGATTGGTSGGLGGSGDRRLFAVQRELADVIVVGAGTARAENYGGARMTAGQSLSPSMRWTLKPSRGPFVSRSVRLNSLT